MKYISREHSLVWDWLERLSHSKEVLAELTPGEIDSLIDEIGDVLDEYAYNSMGDDA